MGLRTDYKYELLLYPDSTSYNCLEVIEKAKGLFDEWAYILHDKDIFPGGELKKPHYHFVARYGDNSKQTPEYIAYALSIPLNAIANIRKWKSSLRYLTHADNPEKYPYDKSEVIASSVSILEFAYQLSDEFQARAIYDYIVRCRGSPTVEQVLVWSLDNDCYSAFRRGFAIWSKILKSSNGGQL